MSSLFFIAAPFCRCGCIANTVVYSNGHCNDDNATALKVTNAVSLTSSVNIVVGFIVFLRQRHLVNAHLNSLVNRFLRNPCKCLIRGNVYPEVVDQSFFFLLLFCAYLGGLSVKGTLKAE